MPAYDITYNNQGEAMIAVLVAKKESTLDSEKIEGRYDNLRSDSADRGYKARVRYRKQLEALREKLKNQQNGAGGMPGMPGKGGFAGSSGGPPSGAGGSSGGRLPGMPGAGGMPGMPGDIGGENGEGGQNTQRVEKAIKYIPLKELDTAVKAGNIPAFTVVPLRLITVNAVVPYKRRLEEGPQTGPAAAPSGSQREKGRDRKVRCRGQTVGTVVRRLRGAAPGPAHRGIGKELYVYEDWADVKDPRDTSGNYKFEEIYVDRIDSKKIADHVDEGYLPYFIKPEFMLVMPLPQLAKDLNVKYPEVQLPAILANIEKLKKANQKEIPPSELLKQLSKSRPKSELYKGKTASNLGGLGYDPSRMFRADAEHSRG